MKTPILYNYEYDQYQQNTQSAPRNIKKKKRRAEGRWYLEASVEEGKEEKRVVVVAKGWIIHTLFHCTNKTSLPSNPLINNYLQSFDLDLKYRDRVMKKPLKSLTYSSIYSIKLLMYVCWNIWPGSWEKDVETPLTLNKYTKQHQASSFILLIY